MEKIRNRIITSWTVEKICSEPTEVKGEVWVIETISEGYDQRGQD